MGIKNIRIENLLSFKSIEIRELATINCTLGKNNAGKSNIFKLINFYYKALEEERCLAPELNSNYDTNGFIEITFDTSHINKIVHSIKNNGNSYFQKVRMTLFSKSFKFPKAVITIPNFIHSKDNNEFSLRLVVNSDGTFYFPKTERNVKKIILDIFPLFEIDSRQLNLHNWDELWIFLGKLRPFNAVDFQKELKEMIDDNPKLLAYKNNINEVNELSNTTKYTYRDKIVNYLRAGLKGDKFEFDGFELSKTSDGTNSYNHIITVFRLVSYLSRRTYQTPIIYVDEPEIGLHPKMNERLIHELSETLNKCYKKKDGSLLHSPQPKFIFSTHSPNIVKQVIKQFQNNHKIYHFTKRKNESTIVSSANSNFKDKNFLCNFSDNEARLFFSSFILFVEGQTEKELFENDNLTLKFPHLIDIDIYQASDENVSKRITPDFVNTEVPYRFLFDADKALNIYKNAKTNKHQLKFKRYGSTLDATPSAMKNEKKKSFLGFCKKSDDRYALSKKFITYHDAEIQLSEFHLNVTRPSTLKPFYMELNSLLVKQRCIVVSTTIEGCLINFDSKDIFYSWLKNVRNVNIDPILARVDRSSYFNNEALIQYFRIIFNGKSETLVNYKNFCKGNLVNARSQKVMRWLEAKTISNSQLGKTDGWVTSFLSFAIDHIEKESKQKNVAFNKIFSNYFKELYGIISELRYGS